MSTPCTMSSGSFPERRAAITHETSPIDPSGPGSKTCSACTRPASIVGAELGRDPASPMDEAFTGNPRSRAPFTFGASTGGILNLAFGGCGFSR